MLRNLKALPPRSQYFLGAALVVASATLPATEALAQDRDLEICLAIPDIGNRVSCYDAVARARSEQGRATASVPAVANAPAPAVRNPQSDFGLSEARRETQRPVEERVPDSITAVVVSSRIVGAGYWEFVMTDNSVWRLTEVRKTFRRPAAGDEVTIKQGAMNSYHLRLGNQPTMLAVRIR